MNLTLKDLGYLLIYLDKQTNILHLDWNENSENIDEEEYKHSAIVFRDLVLAHKNSITLVLNNLQKFKYVITSEQQNFIAEQIMGVLFANGLEKMALVLPEESFFSQVSTEQVTDEIANQNMAESKVHNFTSTQDAENWLLLK